MGKSPGKWIKTLLFGKKASKSNLSRNVVSKAVNEREDCVSAKAPIADLALASHSVHASTDRNGGNSALEQGVTTNLPHDGAVLSARTQDTDTQGNTIPRAPNDPERIRQEKAVTKAQAAFRGYLARRAFRALKGIIRLQALVRGHLVRRQAVATLYSMREIVKLQALVRGRRVRISDIGVEVHKKCGLGKPLAAKCLNSFGASASMRKDKLSSNAFVSKLLASSPTAMALRLQYSLGEPNSAWNWLEQWTLSRFWEPLPQPKMALDSKFSRKQGGIQAVATNPGRSKRSVRRSPTANVDNGPLHSNSESEKPKRNVRKIVGHPAESVQENPQNELEKVKRNLRKISHVTVEASDQAEVEAPKQSLIKASSSPAPDVSMQVVTDSAEKTKTDTTVVVPKQPDVESTPKALVEDGQVNMLHDDHPAVEVHPSESCGKDNNISAVSGESNSKEEQHSNENQKTSRGRASLPAKQELQENGLQNTPTLPSYMAATESAKAKLRGQASPRLVQDSVEKNDFTRRHSLPSSTNGKISSVSPRTHRSAQASCKGGIRSDKSLLSSRNGNEKVTQAEWRR